MFNISQNTLRVAGIAALSVAAISAHAWSLDLLGSYTLSGGVPTLTEAYETSNLIGSSFTFTDSISNLFTSSAPVISSFDFTGTSVLKLDSSGTASFSTTSGVESFSGTWAELTGTTASTSTTGTYSATFDSTSDTFSFAFGGGQAVPEPISMALLGTGAVGLILRRKKNS